MTFPRMCSRVGAADWCLCWWRCPLCFTHKCGHPVHISKLPSEGHRCRESKSRAVDRLTNTMSGQNASSYPRSPGKRSLSSFSEALPGVEWDPSPGADLLGECTGQSWARGWLCHLLWGHTGQITDPSTLSFLICKVGRNLMLLRIIRTCKPRAPDLTHSEQCYGSYCSCMLLRLNPLPVISNKF